MELSQLTAISPIDGRYRKQVQQLDEYFSEFGLIKYRVLIEIEYLLFLQKKKFVKLPGKTVKHLQKLKEDVRDTRVKMDLKTYRMKFTPNQTLSIHQNSACVGGILFDIFFDKN